MKHEPRIVFIIVLLIVFTFGGAALAQEEGGRDQPAATPAPAPTPAPAQAPTPAPAPAPAAAPPAGEKPAALPWFAPTLRFAFGGGGGNGRFKWEMIDHDLNFEEDVELNNVGHAALIPEFFFMPTQGRRFIISGSMPMGGGSGTLHSDTIFDDNVFHYSFVFLNVGLGYQWFLGDRQKTNVLLLTHFGPGRYAMTVEWEGETKRSRVLGASDFDLSGGITHRFDGGFLLGFTTDLWSISFSGKAGSNDKGYVYGPVNAYASGNISGIRINLLAGWTYF